MEAQLNDMDCAFGTTNDKIDDVVPKSNEKLSEVDIAGLGKYQITFLGSCRGPLKLYHRSRIIHPLSRGCWASQTDLSPGLKSTRGRSAETPIEMLCFQHRI